MSSVLHTIATLCMVMLAGATGAAEDSITLRGTSIAMPVDIERIEAGRVFYTDASGSTQRRPLRDVARLAFDDLASLDAANDALEQDAYSVARESLMLALLEARDDTQRIWVRAQLAKTHDILGEYVQAAGHFAALVTLDEHVSWLTYAPTGDMNDVSYPIAHEAITHLRKARDTVTSTQLASRLDALHDRIEPIYQLRAARYDGPAIEPGSTISGIAISTLQNPDDQSDADEDDDQQDDPPAQDDSDEPRDDDASHPTRSGSSPDAIEYMLEREQWSDALAACERAAQRPGRREIAELLHQYGSALQGVGRDKDASVMFLRCAILHRGSPFASRSLIEAAIIYRDTYQRHGAARRLLDRAAQEEAAYNRAAVLKRIENVRSSLAHSP